MELASQKPEVVAAAVQDSRSPYQTLKLLGFPSYPTRAEQLCDAIFFYGWSTAHWISPLPPTPPVRDFAGWKPESRGHHGERFERRFTEHLRLMLRAVAAEGVVTAGPTVADGVFSYGSVEFWTECMVPGWAPLGLATPTPPWDGVVVTGERSVTVVEVKASRKAGRRLPSQLKKRAAWLDVMALNGWAVTVVGVTGWAALPDPAHLWMKKVQAEGYCTYGLSELTLAHLLR